MSKTFDTLNKPQGQNRDFSDYTDQDIDAVIVYLAKIARETKTEYGLSKEQVAARYYRFHSIIESWPEEFYKRVSQRIVDNAQGEQSFWVRPADSVILAARAAELT